MSFVRNIVTDLVEKKLWPVAVALLIAVVAVPVVLGRSSGDAPSAVAALPATPIPHPAEGTVVTADVSTSSAPVDRSGPVHNPFVQHHVPKAAVAATPSGSSSASAAKAPAATLSADPISSAVQTTKSLVQGFSGGSSTPSAPSTPAAGTQGSTPAQTPAKPKAAGGSTYHIAIRFGEAGEQKLIKNVARLTPLPSSDSPFFVFLGLSDDGKRAVFLVSGDALPNGDGTCKPSDDNCQTVELAPGDAEFFDMQTGTAGVVEYELTVESIRKFPAPSKAVAAKAHARESSAGRDFLRETIADEPQLLSGWDYDRGSGLLVEKAPASVDGDVAHLPAGVAEAADGQQDGGTATVATTPADPAQ